MMNKYKLKIGDIVKYHSYKTEYKIVRFHSKNPDYCDLELTKIDPKNITVRSIIGEVFRNSPAWRLEIVKKSARHPLTTIFQ